jgi:hypothetical protein
MYTLAGQPAKQVYTQAGQANVHPGRPAKQMYTLAGQAAKQMHTRAAGQASVHHGRPAGQAIVNQFLDRGFPQVAMSQNSGKRNVLENKSF